MVSQQSIEKQLKEIDFDPKGWNRSEVGELHNIILPDESIYECVNGIYEGGFALLVASDIRILLVDKKIFGYLNVEDLRFDMINEIDYNHRFAGATAIISSGSKTMVFRSYNKERLRKLIGHVQHCMALGKKKQTDNAEGQHQHLEQINQQLQEYLLSQHEQQQKMSQQLQKMQENGNSTLEIPKLTTTDMPSSLKDHLYANRLVEKYQQDTGHELPMPQATLVPAAAHAGPAVSNQIEEIYSEGLKEVFGKAQSKLSAFEFEVNPIKAAFAILPIAVRSRRFGISMPSLPSFFPPLGATSQAAAAKR